jgi:hypothetical protein
MPVLHINKKLGGNLRVCFAPSQIRTGVLALSPLHGDERVEKWKIRLYRRSVCPQPGRTGVLALSPLHGDERVEKWKIRLYRRSVCPQPDSNWRFSLESPPRG